VTRDPFDRWLEEEFAAPPSAPAGFTDRVMARVDVTAQLAASPAPRVSWREARNLSALPWWVRATMDPAMVLATIVAGASLAWREQLLQFGDDLLAGATRLSPGATAPWAAPLQDPRVMLVVTLALAPSIVWMSVRLYRWGRRLTAR